MYVCFCVCLGTVETQSVPLAVSSSMEEARGCGFRGDESEVSISGGWEEPKPPLLSSRFVAPSPVSQCWASSGRKPRCRSGCLAVVPLKDRSVCVLI